MGRAIEHAGRYLYALASGVYLYTAGPFVPRHRRMLTEVARHFGYRAVGAPREVLPGVELDALVPPSTPFALHHPQAHDGNVTLYELVTIARTVAHVRPSAAFEIGTFNGRTTLNIAANSPEQAMTYTLDLPAEGLNEAGLPLDPADVKYVQKQVSGELFLGTPLASRIRQLLGDSARFDYAPYRGKMDLVFVDGAHSYEYVISDSRNALELLRDGTGTILWHDYAGWPGVTRALNEMYQQGGVWSGLRWVRGTTVAHLRLENGKPVVS